MSKHKQKGDSKRPDAGSTKTVRKDTPNNYGRLGDPGAIGLSRKAPAVISQSSFTYRKNAKTLKQ